MEYLIALDSGGTKTNTIIFDTSGHIFRWNVAYGCNPLDIGVEPARTRLKDILREAVTQAPGEVTAIYAAVAGCGYYRESEFPDLSAREVGVQKLFIDDDGRSVISSELSHAEQGCGLICGTGCSMWFRKKGLRKLERTGGWGYLLDTLGSGYSLGKDAIRAACLAHDDRAPQTLLSELVEAELKGDLVAGIPQIYAGGRRRIASFAYTVFQAAERGDEVARRILWENAGHIADLIWWADRRLEGEYTVILGGGIVSAFPEYMEAIRQRSPERAQLQLATAPPVYGAAVEAMDMTGRMVDETFRENFLRDYMVLNVR